VATLGAVLVWIDLEMTGLDPSRHVIVEIASLITDDELEIVGEGPQLVLTASAAQMGEMDEVVARMHHRSGLAQDIAASSLSMEEAQAATMDFLRRHIDEPGTVPLAGNSIGTDRRFLAAQMPEIESFLHYRCVDVSTVKELARRWYPELMAEAPEKHGSHRALHDIKESIAELRFYRERLFRQPERDHER
jgi:oligoribonuclease